MKTLKFITVVALMISTIVACDNDEIFNGSGNIIPEERILDPFTKIESSGVFDIYIVQGAAQKVVLAADDNIIGNVKTTVSNGTLKVYLKDGNYNHINTSLTITVDELTKVLNEGSGSVEAIGFENNAALEIFNSGDGSIYYEGTTKDLQIKNYGSGTIDCMDLLSESTRIQIEGSGDSYLSVANELKGKIEGSGFIYYKGSPLVDVDIEGSGQLIKMY